jgi:hypothetical protein
MEVSYCVDFRISVPVQRVLPSAYTARHRRGDCGKTRPRAGANRADAARCVTLLSRLPANNAKAASLHRSLEEPFGGHQLNPDLRQ